MTENIFSIILLTFNRPQLAQSSMRSLAAQTLSEFEVFVLDNGSAISIEAEAKEILGNNLTQYIRSEVNLRSDVAEWIQNIFPRLSGRYFLLLADDDGLVPSALERVHRAFITSNSKIITSGYLEYVHPEGRDMDGLLGNQLLYLPASGQLQKFLSRDAVLSAFSAWGVGEYYSKQQLPILQPSTIWIEMDLVRSVVSETGTLLVKPLWDVGFLSALLHTEDFYHLDLPIGIRGIAPQRDLDGALAGKRTHWKPFRNELIHVPCRALSFVNMGVESHLRVAEGNMSLIGTYSLELQLLYYIRHILEVVSDKPLQKQTLVDFYEWAKVLLRIPAHKAIHLFLKFVIFLIKYVKKQLVFMLRSKIKEEDHRAQWFNGNYLGFFDLSSCAHWIEKNILPSLDYDGIGKG